MDFARAIGESNQFIGSDGNLLEGGANFLKGMANFAGDMTKIDAEIRNSFIAAKASWSIYKRQCTGSYYKTNRTSIEPKYGIVI